MAVTCSDITAVPRRAKARTISRSLTIPSTEAPSPETTTAPIRCSARTAKDAAPSYPGGRNDPRALDAKQIADTHPAPSDTGIAPTVLGSLPSSGSLPEPRHSEPWLPGKRPATGSGSDPAVVAALRFRGTARALAATPEPGAGEPLPRQLASLGGPVDLVVDPVTAGVPGPSRLWHA